MWITSLLLNLQVAKIPLCSALADGSEILHQFEYPTNCCISKFHLGIRYISHLLGILRIPYPTKKLFLSKECSWICENISIVPVLGRLFYINIHPGSTLELITLELMGSPNEISFPTTKNGYALNKDPTMIAGYNNNAKQDESLKIKDTNHNSWWLALKRKITFIYIKYIFYIYIYIFFWRRKSATLPLWWIRHETFGPQAMLEKLYLVPSGTIFCPATKLVSMFVFPGHPQSLTWISLSGGCHCQVIYVKLQEGYVFQKRIDSWQVKTLPPVFQVLC